MKYGLTLFSLSVFCIFSVFQTLRIIDLQTRLETTREQTRRALEQTQSCLVAKDSLERSFYNMENANAINIDTIHKLERFIRSAARGETKNDQR